jgi:hypothetical protein
VDTDGDGTSDARDVAPLNPSVARTDTGGDDDRTERRTDRTVAEPVEGVTTSEREERTGTGGVGTSVETPGFGVVAAAAALVLVGMRCLRE